MINLLSVVGEEERAGATLVRLIGGSFALAYRTYIPYFLTGSLVLALGVLIYRRLRISWHIWRLSSLDYGVYKVSCERLIESGKLAVEPLIKTLEHKKSWVVRGRVAELLGRIGDPRAIDPLCKSAQRDKEVDVCLKAVKALCSFDDKSAIPRLVGILFSPIAHTNKKIDHQVDVVEVVAFALGRIGDKAAVPDLIEALKQNYYYHYGGNVVVDYTDLSEDVARAYKRMYPTRDEPRPRAYCAIIYALGKIGDGSAIPAIRKAWRDHGYDEKVCQAAKETIEEIEANTKQEE